MLSLINHESFAYHHVPDPLTEAAMILSIGFEKRTRTDYYWDGRMRENDLQNCVFQYTVSGYGEVQAGEETIQVRPGEAFIVQIPSDHCYYLPEESSHWEFLFITLKGSKATECWDFMQKAFGTKITFTDNAPLLLRLQKIYQKAASEGIQDPFVSSAHAYEFIMAFYRFAKGIDQVTEQVPADLQAAIHYMEAHFREGLSLDDIAEAAGLSKYYFTSKFQKHLNMTPIQYVTKLRIQKAMELLMTTNDTLHDIAIEIGYDNANYFSKVFRKTIGITADNFRKDKKMSGFKKHVIY